MTDESHMPEESAPAEAPDTARAQEVVAAPTQTVSSESLVSVAGMIVLASYLIFEVITDDYSLTTLAVVLAATAVILPRVSRSGVENLAPFSVLMKVVGYGLALTGLTEIIFDLEAGVFEGFLTVIAALVAYAGFALAYLGARGIKT